MRKTKYSIAVFGVLFSIFFLWTQTAFAEPYVSFKGGVGFLDTESKVVGSGEQSVSTATSYDNGWGISGAVGWDFGDLGLGDKVGFRAEVEGLHTENSENEITRSQLVEVVVPCPEGILAKGIKPEVCTDKQLQKSKRSGNGTDRFDGLFFNGYFDFPLFNNLEGYAGGGVSIDLGWQTILGGIWKFAPNWGATTEFRYVVDNDLDYTNPMLLFGVRYSF